MSMTQSTSIIGVTLAMPINKQEICKLTVIILGLWFKDQIFMLAVSQRHVSQLSNDISICIDQFVVFTTTANLFGTEIRVDKIRQV